MFKKTIVLTSLLIMVFCGTSLAYLIPPKESGIKYFYMFGPEGNPYYGAYTGDFILYIDVPDNVGKEVIIRVFDPDTGGKNDDNYRDWNTETEFSIYGEGLLDKKSFDSGGYDNQAYQFGPYPVNKGMHVDDKYRFKLVVKAIKGDDANLFNVEVEPQEAQVYTFALPFRLATYEGQEMNFYPGFPAKTDFVVIRNYDIDPEGGVGYVYTAQRRYKISDSGSADWAETQVPVNASSPQQLRYTITKKTQKHGNAVISALDDKGNLLPIYLRPENLTSVNTQKTTVASITPKKRPVPETKKAKKSTPKKVAKALAKPLVKKYTPETETQIPTKCDTFIFDATESYDPNKRPLSYHWDFGDGDTSDKPVITHTFKKPGEYTVALTVVNNTQLGCNKDTTTKTVRVNFPPEPVVDMPATACVGEEIVFDGSGSSDTPSDNLTYNWDFGDGATSQQARATHKFSKGGIYKVGLTVKDDSGTPCDTSVIRRTIRVNSAPSVKLAEPITICQTNPEEPLEVKFDGSNASDPENDNLTYIWDFGDGNSDEGQVVTHVYEKGGNYTAKLTVTDDSGSACSSTIASLPVNLNRSPVAVALDTQSICTADEVVLDASKSYDKDGDVLSYSWDLGDGTTKEGKKITHRYEKGGVYNVNLNIDDGRGTGCSRVSVPVAVTVNSGPYASLDVEKLVCVGEQVSFDASGSHDLDKDALTYSWNFGDGKVLKAGPQVTHKYEKGGVYDVTLTVDDGKKSPCSKVIEQTKIKVNTPPVANSGPNLVCCVGETAHFDATRSFDPDNDKLTYIWDFGDGNTAEGVKATHKYQKSGTYTVNLIVKDNSGSKCNTATAKFVAEVSESPVSVIKVKAKQ